MGRKGAASHEPFGIESLQIEKFRNFHNMTVPIGRYVTVISGQNGTGKSTLLGMIGQPLGLKDYKDIFDRRMVAKFTDMFRLSPEHDVPGEHLYFMNFRSDDLYVEGKTVQVKSQLRSGYKMPVRLVTGESHAKGHGNVDYPVIYLGLKRTYPVGEIRAESEDLHLTDEERVLFNIWYQKVFSAWEQDDLEPVGLEKKGMRKDTILVNTPTYDYAANSAGQDNLGQILAALLSFRRLKDTLGEDYHGGVLLIDELDATLFPSSQEELLEVLYKQGMELNLQVVFTTHSLSLIEKATNTGKPGDIEVVYLRRRDSGITMIPHPTMDDVKADLLIRPPKRHRPTKVEVWCEDEEAAWLLRAMLPQSVKAKCNIISAGVGSAELVELASKGIPTLENVVFAPDGDVLKEGSNHNKIKRSRSLVVLPTDKMSPEGSIFSTLSRMPDDGEFWSSMDGESHYTRQMFRSRYKKGC